jgi:circadian clock protein KaiB
MDARPDDPNLVPQPPPDGEVYVLRLFVTGMTPRSLDAIARTKAVCEEYLKGRYELEVIDIYLRPELARGEQIVAAPTLVRKLPEPIRRLVGDLSDTDRVLAGLDLRTRPTPPTERG